MYIDDADLYFDQATSEAITIAGIASVVYGHYDREYVEIDIGQVAISGYKPVVTCSSAAVATASRGAAVSIADVSETFKIAYIEKMDRIETRLILEET